MGKTFADGGSDSTMTQLFHSVDREEQIGSKMRFSMVAFLVLTCGWTGCSIDAEGNRVIGGPGFGDATLYEKPNPAIGIKDRSDVISKYLAHKELAPIEGVWVWDNNHYEVAIIRNSTEHYKEYDYVGVVTETRTNTWARGQIKLLLKETASPQAYSGVYFDVRLLHSVLMAQSGWVMVKWVCAAFMGMA